MKNRKHLLQTLIESFVDVAKTYSLIYKDRLSTNETPKKNKPLRKATRSLDDSTFTADPTKLSLSRQMSYKEEFKAAIEWI